LTNLSLNRSNTVYESVVPKPKINRDKVIIEDWNSDDEDDVSAVKTVSPVKTNETQTVRNRVDKIGKISQKEGIERPVKKRGKRKKQIAKEGIHVDKTAQYETEEEREAHMKDKVTDPSSGSDIGIDAIPTVTKPPSVVDWKIIPQLELYMLVIKKYGANIPEEMYDKVLWGELKTMFDPPLSDDAIWSWPLQQKMVNWRYYDSCVVHCLTLDASTIYMLADRKYPLSKDACQAMLNIKLQGGTKDEVCYQLVRINVFLT
ncbi:hypothetical protein Tco_0023178, partial [Tanacetum coccineum]